MADEVVTGVFVLVGAAVLVAGSMWLSQDRWGGEYRTLEARFQTVGQLRPGNSVRIRGVDVGHVQDIAVEQEAARVTLRVRQEAPLPVNPVVFLQPISLFGEWAASIEAGRRHPSALADTARMPEGVLPGVTASDFSELSEYTADIASNLEGITERLEVAFNRQTAENLARSVENFEQASAELVALLERQRKGFGGFADDMASAGRTLRRVAADLDSTVRRLEAATAEGELAAILDNTRDATAGLARVSSNLDSTSLAARQTIARADSALGQAESILSRVNRGEGSLGRLASDPLLYEDLSSTLRELQALLDDLKQNPGKYFKFSIF
jgi:phospholipid/cholesterol/gamma-HCH transport system substrate-binding protein